jgi:hypothetical protein
MAYIQFLEKMARHDLTRVAILHKKCPKCSCALAYFGYGETWCVSDNCSYSELQLIGTRIMPPKRMMYMSIHETFKPAY